MISKVQGSWSHARAGSLLIWTVKLLSSLKWGIVLLALLAAVVAGATVLEASQGRAVAQWYVYQSSWFIALLALLGVNIFFATIIRCPWKRHQVGFLVAHGGLLVLLVGSILTFTRGLDGQVTLTEGKSTTTMLLPHLDQVTAFWMDRPEEAPYEFSFEPGPVHWREGKTLHLGHVDGIGVRVLHYYRHAKAIEEWLPDEKGTGGPLVKLAIRGEGAPQVEQLLVDQDYGDEATDPVCVRLQRATADVMLEEFLKPPKDSLGTKGLLLAYFGGRCQRIPVDGNIGKKVTLDPQGVAVEIVDYLPNARPDNHGQFRSINESPQNPLLQLNVSHPVHKEPMRQLASARKPLLNLDYVYGQTCPVKFVYYHPSPNPSPAVEFLQAANGKLYCRVLTDGQYQSRGEVGVGSIVPLPGSGQLSLTEYLPHTQLSVTFEPLSISANQKVPPEPAAEIELSLAGQTHTLWLQKKGNSLYQTRAVATPQGTLGLKLAEAEKDLGFSLELVKFHRGTNPGGFGNATYASVIRLQDDRQGVDRQQEISMNTPLTHNHLTFYQASFGDGGHGRASSTLSVAHDPGSVLKYSGCLLVCLGIALMFFMRAYFFKQVPPLLGQRGSTVFGEGSPAVDLKQEPCTAGPVFNGPHHPFSLNALRVREGAAGATCEDTDGN